MDQDKIRKEMEQLIKTRAAKSELEVCEFYHLYLNRQLNINPYNKSQNFVPIFFLIYSIGHFFHSLLMVLYSIFIFLILKGLNYIIINKQIEILTSMAYSKFLQLI